MRNPDPESGSGCRIVEIWRRCLTFGPLLRCFTPGKVNPKSKTYAEYLRATAVPISFDGTTGTGKCNVLQFFLYLYKRGGGIILKVRRRLQIDVRLIVKKILNYSNFFISNFLFRYTWRQRRWCYWHYSTVWRPLVERLLHLHQNFGGTVYQVSFVFVENIKTLCTVLPN